MLRLNPKDNVAVALRRLQRGDRAEVEDGYVDVAEPIPFGHKIALGRISKGDGVIKYGEIIGTATSQVDPGQHVHVHNLQSARLPGQPT